MKYWKYIIHLRVYNITDINDITRILIIGFCQRLSVLSPADLNKHLIIHENVIYLLHIIYVFDEIDESSAG